MGKLEGRTAIVTGAGRGLGKQIAIKYAEEGANLAICARSLDRLAETERLCREAGAEVLSFVCDVTKIDQMEAFVAATAEKFGGIDILYNNAMATTCGHKHFEDHTQEDFDMFYQSGLMSSFHMMRLCFPWLKKSGHGKVICVGSGAGVEGQFGMTAYGAIKEATRAMARTAAREWGKYNINVNTINPGAITDFYYEQLEKMPEGERDPMKLGFNPTIIGRIGDAYEDIAPVAVFLASEDSRHITGQTIMAEGGVTMIP
ncbi:MAG: SDR family oxidoreductase [Clostridia bacterium]|nr:SDR family oxidoreductase [Clostridia bacterium]